jgi:hypothetical protein
VYFPQLSGYGIYRPSAADSDSAQSAVCPQSTLAKQCADFAHGVVEAAGRVGGNLGLLKHAAVFIDDSERDFRASNVNRCNHCFSLLEYAFSKLCIKSFH